MYIVVLASAAPVWAQSNTFHVFPQFADGVLGGTAYRSTLMIQPSFSSTSITCNLTLRGMTTNFGSGQGSSFSITVPSNGFTLLRTAGTQGFQSGYATLTCSTFVDAHVLYTLYVAGSKVSEATVFSSSASYFVKLVADQTEGARLGIAIANNTDIAHTYEIRLTTTAGTAFTTGTVTVGARQSLARFLDELVPASRNQLLQAEIRATDFSDVSVIGLRFTGLAFTTIPAN